MLRWTTLFLLLSFVDIQAQNIQIQGIIKDSLSNEGLPLATVKLLNLTPAQVTQTDKAGAFLFSQLKSGEYQLLISYVGYVTKQIRINLKEDKNLVTIDPILLALENTHLKEIKVKASKAFIIQESDKIVLNVAESVMANNGNAMDVLNAAPMLTFSQKGDATFKGKKVIFLIDGKPSNVTGESLESILSSLPSQSIEKIELISNPSAKYEAMGAAIINIHTLKMKNLGLNGTWTLGAAQGIHSRYNSGISLNYRQEKFSLFGTYNFQHIEQFYQTNTIQQLKNSDGNIYQITNNSSYDLRKRNLNFLKVGADYYLSKKTIIGFVIQSNTIERNRIVTGSNQFVNTSSGKTDSLQNKTVPGNASLGNINVNFNLRKQFAKKNQTLDIDLDWGKTRVNWQDNIFLNVYDANQENKYNLSLQMPWAQQISTQSFKIDYKQAIRIGTLEAGGQLRSTQTATNALYEQNNGSDWVVNTDWSSDFHYQERVEALYVNLSGKIKDKISYQVGLREEQTHVKTLETISNESHSQDYWHLFPTGSLGYTLSDKNQFSLSFSRRINRPPYNLLNSRLIFNSLSFFDQGNPSLQPSIGNSVELAYTYKQNWTFNLGYTLTTNDFTDSYSIKNNTITIYQEINFSKSELFSASINLNKQLNSWWLSESGIQGFYMKNYLNIAGVAMNNGYSGKIYTKNYLTLNKSIKIDVSATYQPNNIVTIYWEKPIFIMDIGLTSSILNKKIDMRIWLSDVFNSNLDRFGFSNNKLNSTESIKFESQLLRLSLTYKFGNKNVKLKERKTGLEQESQRLNANK